MTNFWLNDIVVDPRKYDSNGNFVVSSVDTLLGYNGNISGNIINSTLYGGVPDVEMGHGSSVNFYNDSIIAQGLTVTPRTIYYNYDSAVLFGQATVNFWNSNIQNVNSTSSEYGVYTANPNSIVNLYHTSITNSGGSPQYDWRSQWHPHKHSLVIGVLRSAESGYLALFCWMRTTYFLVATFIQTENWPI